jgi:hypothetical protein
MAKKKLLNLRECEQQFPEAFQDANGNPDKRLKENHKRAMVHMINQGESPFDAKLKALSIALPPDHWEQVPPAGAWPKLVYYEDGKTVKTVEDEDEYAELMKQKGWSLKPPQKHLDRLQRGTQPRDENIKRLQRELDAELKKKEEEKAAEVAA